MGYDIVALSEADLSYGNTYLNRLSAVGTFPFLAPDAVEIDFTQSFVLEKVGEHTVAFVAGVACEAAISQADLIFALGDLEDLEHIDVIIYPDDIKPTVAEAGVLSVGCKPEGKTLGVLALWLDVHGKLSRHYATELALTGDVAESESVRQLLTDFYREVSPTSDRTPLFADLPLERDPQNGYVSATACQQCHEQEYFQWPATRHAFAYHTHW